MGKKCAKFSPDKPNQILICEYDELGQCRKNCVTMEIEAAAELHPQVKTEMLRFTNAVARYHGK